jgi:hypothetical protein
VLRSAGGGGCGGDGGGAGQNLRGGARVPARHGGAIIAPHQIKLPHRINVLSTKV